MVKTKQTKSQFMETKQKIRCAQSAQIQMNFFRIFFSKTLLYRWLCHGTSASILCLTAFDLILCYLWN